MALKPLSNFKNLISLTLGGNPVSTFEEIQFLTENQEIRELDFIDCPISNEPDYRKKLYELFPNLDVLDGIDKDGNVIEDDEDIDESENIEEEFIYNF